MAAPEGSERGNGGLVKMDSTEFRWVFPDADVSDSGSVDLPPDAGAAASAPTTKNTMTPRPPLTMPLSASSAPPPASTPSTSKPSTSPAPTATTTRNVVLVLQTLGIVFGDVGTSPLYTFDVMFNKAPIGDQRDVLGALSLVLNAKASLLPNQLLSDARISRFRLKVPSPELERSLKIKEYLETSLTLKKLLLMLVLFGTSMVIADEVVTPTMSVMSAVDGLKVGIASVGQDEVVMISVAFLIVLFSVQRFGTSKVGLAVGPALFIWFCSLGGIGIYNLVKYGTTVFRAFNPVYIYYYFDRNSTRAWMSLGGCLLCATGSEAMFANLYYFSVRSVQLMFMFLVLPCLLVRYLGQAAFLMENLTQNEQVFFSSVPGCTFWPVFFIAIIAALIASRAMTTTTFSCIKQSTALGCFPRLKIIHTSRKFMGQIYIPIINWFLLVSCLAFVATFGSIYETGNAYGTATRMLGRNITRYLNSF